MEKIVTLAIPLYFGSLFVEAWFSHHKKKGYFYLKDSLGNLGTGIMMQLLEIFFKAPFIAFYFYLYQNYNILNADHFNFWVTDITTLPGLLSWASVFLIVDFVYYFFHRHSHEVNLLWSAHMVHHSSEEYNFSVALRQSTFQGLYFVCYLLVLAVLGIPPEMILPCYGINLIYQFFLHTRFVGKLGFLDLIFSTPSNHRVHHARQSKYLDCNYGGVLIIWDRMFGTFTREEEEPRYGVYPRFQSYDPVRANFMPITELYGYFCQAKGIEKFHVLFRGPLWIFERFKKGKNLNIIDSGRPADKLAFLYFGAALLIALTILFVPTLSKSLQIGLVLFDLLLLGLMGRRLDGPKTESTSDLIAPVISK